MRRFMKDMLQRGGRTAERSQATSGLMMAPDTNAAYLKSWFDEATETPGEKAGFLSDVATRAIQCGESTEVEAHKFFSMVNEDRNRGLQDLSSGQLTYEQQASMWEQPGSAASQVLDRVLQSAWYTNFDRTRLSNQASGPEVETVTRMFAQPSLEQTMANAAPGAPGLCQGGTRQTSTVAISEFKWATSQAQRDRVRAEIESTCEQLRSRATSTGRSSRALSQFEAALKAESTAATTTEYVKRNLVGFTLNADESYIMDYKTGDEEFDGWLDRIVVRNNEWVSETNPSLKESRRQALDNELDSTSEWFNWTLDP
ncbi:hypothetical protein I316_07070 [Kwoniella heveanensis BCC8398]|uniref:Uncharacterized protein n=1 Tax=Kwoniella heveanensis BCC8398 TaxID=1296120 RepID=A0A1B9GJL3_9TREE|nr:hypothetical protein I316_07070 [Kwoniella heveanensis BCC8398]